MGAAAEQLGFDFDAPCETGDEPRSIQGRFAAFHAENPHVYALFRRFAWEARNAGRERFGAKMIVERMRWHTAVETNGDGFRLNNIYTSRYVRLLIEEDPSWEGFFECRTLTAE